MSTYSAIAHDFTPPTATSVSSQGAGAMILIKSITASSDGTISFQDGSSSVVLDSTYKTYIVKWSNCHPADDGAEFQFQGNAAGGSGFNETINSTHFNALHSESGSAELGYETNHDLANSTNFQTLTRDVGNGNDECTSGELYIFNPSNTTFVTHFISNAMTYHNSDFAEQSYAGGYFNTTSAIDELQFKFSSGNIDAGTFKLYGIA